MTGRGFRVRGAALIAMAGATLGMAGPARADVKAGVDAWSAGIQATRSGDKAGAQRLFAEAIREWQVAANTGDADAQFNLAQAYKLGLGVPQDLGKAEVLYGKAAAQGHLQAADIYGLLLYQRGEHAKAMPYVEGAADRGDPRAQYVRGLALFNGDGAAKDWVRAYALVSLAQLKHQALTAAAAIPALAGPWPLFLDPSGELRQVALTQYRPLAVCANVFGGPVGSDSQR